MAAAKVSACVPIFDDIDLHWLGHRSLLQRACDCLSQVRGISRVVVCGRKHMLAKLPPLKDEDEGERCQLPDAVSKLGFSAKLRTWLLTSPLSVVKDEEVLVVLRPTLPFLPSAVIEACLSRVLKKKVDACLPGRATYILTLHGPIERSAFLDPLRHLYIGRNNAAPYRDTEGCMQEIGLVESIDVSEPDGMVVAEALTAAGTL